jgi:hypothetical protein
MTCYKTQSSSSGERVKINFSRHSLEHGDAERLTTVRAGVTSETTPRLIGRRLRKKSPPSSQLVSACMVDGKKEEFFFRYEKCGSFVCRDGLLVVKCDGHN